MKSILPLRIALLALGLLCLAGSRASAAIALTGYNQPSNSFFDVFVDLQNVMANGPPITPAHSLTNPTHPTFTTMVDTDARFDFGMRGQNGETFTFSSFSSDSSSSDFQTTSHFEAHGSLNSFFDVFLDAAWQSPNGANHSPLSAVAINGPPIFPVTDSISVNYHVKEGDPPFTVGIIVLNHDNQAPLAFTDAVLEPGSLSIMLGSLLAFTGFSGLSFRRRRRPH